MSRSTPSAYDVPADTRDTEAVDAAMRSVGQQGGAAVPLVNDREPTVPARNGRLELVLVRLDPPEG